MTILLATGAGLSVFLLAYLFVALLFPERLS
jgi:K+-transporting ATPase KdpF subunit